MKYLQKQESFSFSTCSSKAGLFSDDEDGGSDGNNHTGGRTADHQQKGYFEISLPSPPPPPPKPPPFITKTNHDVAKVEEFEFCFSFTSKPTLVDFPTTPISARSDHPLRHHEPPITSYPLASSQVVNAVDRKYKHHKKINNPIHYKCIFQNASSPQCHHGSISPYVFPTSRLRTLDKTQRELVKNRTWAKFGGIRKLMVKLRSIKRMLRSSLSVSRPLPLPIEKVNKKTIVGKKLRDCTHMTINNNDNSDEFLTYGQNRNQEDKQSSRIVNFNGFTKMFDGIMKNVRTTRRSKQRESKSCLESIKSSPMHDPGVRNARDERRDSFYLRDHSIQSAIAHCKKSFGK